MHPGQLSISADAVQRLIAAQFSEWARLPVAPVASTGAVNALFRLGDRLVVRFPLEPADAEAVRRRLGAEARAAGELLGRTRFPTPESVALGEPGEGYPLPWSVQTWIPGTTAIEEDPAGSEVFAEDLADFILGVRDIDTRGATFSGPGRGGSLSASDAWMQTCFRHSGALLDVDHLRHLWHEWRSLIPPENPTARVDGSQPSQPCAT